MKKVVLLIFILSLVFILPFATALNKTVEDNARDCIKNKVENNCSSLGIEDMIFSLLSVGKCKTELLNKTQINNCFGTGNSCDLKTTAQSIMALHKVNSNIDGYLNWSLSQNMSTQNLDWLLQIDTTKSSTCIIYDENDNIYSVLIDEDKKLSLTGSNCLTLDSTGYWLKIKPSCYGQEFGISCDEDFITSVLFKKENSPMFYILGNANSSSAGGSTSETVNSKCFKKLSHCDYEGTLWTTLILNLLGEDTSIYLPYLIAFADESSNEKYLPEAFLYELTDKATFRSDLILKQKINKYWYESNDKYYDTALALMPLYGEEIEAKQNSINWLEHNQEEDGCWNLGSIKDTGFLLYSIWPGTFGGGEENGYEEVLDCEYDGGGYCMSQSDCLDVEGSKLSGYNCQYDFDVCCDRELTQTCKELEGEICGSNEECPSSYEIFEADVEYGEVCCFSGECVLIPETNECVDEGYGVCDISPCDSKTQEDISYEYPCPDSTDYCCAPKTEEPRSYLWIWILIILIILVIIAIVFREKFKGFYFKLKHKKKPFPPRRPEIAPRRMPVRRPMPQRRIIPSSRRSIPTNRPLTRPQGKTKEIDDVLKRLKEMGK